MPFRVGLLIWLFTAPFLLFPAGRQDNQSREVENPEGFTESLDIGTLAPGKWNFYLEAEDRGGNTSLAGPYNIYIDPLSDLPVAQIINPQPNMHVQGNLNIVGTCIDDDGVDHVEISISRGADGKGEVVFRGRAEGAEFWSFFLDTQDTEKWRDGIYTVSAWGVDINGLSGTSEQFPAQSHKIHQVIWNLDRKKPEITVTSHELGAILSGRVSFQGTVWDGNGAEYLSYTFDDGVHNTPVRLRYDSRNDIYTFEFSVDTRNLEDGPSVIKFTARDTMRTEGTLSFLTLLNNTGPDVEILYPNPEEAVSGIFTVAGYAIHKVGLSSLTWTLGRESGEIPLIKGNPWWAQEFDIRGQNVRNLDLEIRAVDLSGNVTVVKRRIPVDVEADRPKVTLNEPGDGAIIADSGLNIVGVAADNKGVAAILYSIAGMPPVEIPCSGYFQFTVKDIPGGIHNLEVWARDITGVEGHKVLVRGLVAQGAAPEPRLVRLNSTINRTAASAEFYSGMEINRDAVSTLDLIVNSGSALQSVTCRFGSLAPVPVSVRGSRGGEFTQSIPVPKEIEAGLVKIEIKVTDIHGRETVIEDYIFAGGSGGEGLTWVQPDTGLGDGRIRLSEQGEILVGLANGKPLQSAEISGAGDLSSLNVSVDQYGRLNFSASGDGNYGPLKFILTGRDGTTFTSGDYRFLVDTAGPALEIPDNPDGRWVQNQVQVKFGAADANRIESVDFSISLGAHWQPLLQRDEITSLGNGSVLERVLDISSLADGAINISIRIVDEAGRQTVNTFTVNKDTIAPEARLVVPVSGAKVNGTIRLGIAITEAGRISAVDYENPGRETAGQTVSRQIYPDPENGELPLTFLDVVLDAGETPLSENMRFVFTDMAGNSSVLSSWPFVIDEEMDLPVLEINLPFDNEVITSDFVISGISYDDDEIKQIYYSIDGAPEQIQETGNGFSISVPLSSMTDNEHSVTITAEDIFGVKSRPQTRSFRVSLAEPTASFSLPALGEIVGGTVHISGKSFDNNGIKNIQVSLDNGNSFNDAAGQDDWTYTFNSLILKDGPSVVFIRVWDNYEISAMYSSMLVIDNTSPELVVDTPRDGTVTTGPVYITGRAVDNLTLETLGVRVSSLEGVSIPAELAFMNLEPGNLLLEELELGSLPDGTYNIEVWATDKAENVTRLSRNIQLLKGNQRNFVDNLYPLNGEYLKGNFNLYGYAGGIDTAAEVTLLVNDNVIGTASVNEAGYYRFTLGDENLSAGVNRIVVRSDFGGRETVESPVRTINYEPYGPWVTVDSMNMGDFAFERPWLMGRAGYTVSAEDAATLADRSTGREARAAIQAKKVARIELSFDNGYTFFPAGRTREEGYDWRYRLETGDMAEGLHYLIVRAVMENGDAAVTRFLIQVDKTPPVIRLISPDSGGRYNETITYTALASDDVELQGMNYHLRRGDLAMYQVPAFIQGLYFEATIPPFIRQLWNEAPAIFAGGATYMDFGMGLSFFDDNVKVQLQYGFMTRSIYEALGGEGLVRYGGHVLGFKLLANVYTLPVGTLAGPDWEWLSASFALGANFSLFDIAGQGYTQSGSPTWMSALLAQIEFPKVTIPKRTNLRTFSLFTEGQLWFVPTDIDAAANNIDIVVPHVILGARLYIF